MDEKRFFTEETEIEGAFGLNGVRLVVDSHTGVQYLHIRAGANGTGGVTVLVDRDGKPLISEDDRVWR